jgi:hypothetical protein
MNPQSELGDLHEIQASLEDMGEQAEVAQPAKKKKKKKKKKV